MDAALHWQHSTLRVGSMKLCWHSILATNMGQQCNPAIAKDGEMMLNTALSAMESYWLASSPFLAGDDISLPDLLCCCELEQCSVLEAAEGATTLQQLLAKRPKVRAWMLRVKERCAPQYAEAHAVLAQAVQRMMKRKAAGEQSKL